MDRHESVIQENQIVENSYAGKTNLEDYISRISAHGVDDETMKSNTNPPDLSQGIDNEQTPKETNVRLHQTLINSPYTLSIQDEESISYSNTLNYYYHYSNSRRRRREPNGNVESNIDDMDADYSNYFKRHSTKTNTGTYQQSVVVHSQQENIVEEQAEVSGMKDSQTYQQPQFPNAHDAKLPSMMKATTMNVDGDMMQVLLPEQESDECSKNIMIMTTTTKAADAMNTHSETMDGTETMFTEHKPSKVQRQQQQQLNKPSLSLQEDESYSDSFNYYYHYLNNRRSRGTDKDQIK
jgi:hypothetical protein